jgi:hypothetical protein
MKIFRSHHEGAYIRGSFFDKKALYKLALLWQKEGCLGLANELKCSSRKAAGTVSSLRKRVTGNLQGLFASRVVKATDWRADALRVHRLLLKGEYKKAKSFLGSMLKVAEFSQEPPRRSRMGKRQRELMKFAKKYYPKWENYAGDTKTKRLVESLVARGLLETNLYQQFRAIKKPNLD